MKKIAIIFFGLMIFTSIIYNAVDSKSDVVIDSTNSLSTEQLENSNRTYALQIGGSQSYVTEGDPHTLYENSDYVFLGKITEVSSSTVSDGGVIFTDYTIEVIEELNGELSKKTLVVNAMDGEVTLQEYIDVVPEILNKDFGDEIDESEYDTTYVKQESDDNAKLEIGDTRLFFVNYSDNVYFLNHNAEAALEVEIPKTRSYDLSQLTYTNVSSNQQYNGDDFIES